MADPEKPAAPGAGLTYREAGVDIDAGERLVDLVKPMAAATRRPGAGAQLGGFGGLFDLKAAGFVDPILVSGTDGVGTKLEIAQATGLHHTIGIDLVAMCANDVLAQGAEPLFFLDYFATGALDPDHAASVVQGIAAGCQQTGCALIGGETAELPGMYAPGVYDLAGFCVGAAERGQLLPDTDAMQAGDAIIGLASSGLHANGFSLVRAIVARAGLSWDDPAPFAPELRLSEALLTPTRLYAAALLPLIRAGRIRGLAHITGGGVPENLPRALPERLMAQVDWGSWARPALFTWLQEAGGVAEAELRRTFNCGVGMIAIVAAEEADAVCKALSEAGEAAWVCGSLVDADARADGADTPPA